MSDDTRSRAEAHASRAGDSIQSGNVTGQGIAIGHGAKASVTIINEADKAYDVRGLTNPYLGLAAFTYEERAKYAGRERQVAEAVKKLTAPGEQRVLLFITGASGSGKSSFAQAGVLPALEQHYARGVQARIVEGIRPSQRPLERLLDALQRRAELPTHELDITALPYSLYTFLASHTNPQQVNLLVIDQFEELFTQSEPTQRDALFAFLTNLPHFHVLRTHMLVTARSDYLPELFLHPQLYAYAKDGIELRAMTEAELKQAIQRPLQQHSDTHDKRFDIALIDALTADAAKDATYLPLLQITLEDIWARGLLKREAYGNLADAVRQRAEQIFDTGLDGTPRIPAEQDALMETFLDLVEVSLDDDARRDIRRRRTLADLTQNEPSRKQLIDELVTARLLSKGLELRDGRDVEVVDIIHESLIGNWERLSQAIATQRDRLQQRTRFDLALKEWQEHQCADDYLVERVRLSEAQELDAQNDVALRSPAAQELLRRSIKMREAVRQRQVQRARRVAFGLGVLALLAVFAAGTAMWFALQAQKQSRVARAEELAAEAQLVRGRYPQRGLLLALEAMHTLRATDPRNEAPEQAIWDGLISMSGQGLAGHVGAIQAIMLSEDKHTLITGSSDSTIRVWDLTASDPQATVRVLRGHEDAVNALALSKDGHTLVTGSSDSTVRVWDLTAPDPQATVRVLRGHEDAVNALALSKDGHTLVTGSSDSTARVWDLRASDPQATVRVLRGHKGTVGALVLSADGHTLATARGESLVLHADDRTARVWDLTATDPQATVRVFSGHEDLVKELALSEDGRTLVTATGDIVDETETGFIGTEGRGFTMRIWDLTVPDLQAPIHTLRVSDSAVSEMVLSEDGHTLITGTNDGPVVVWDLTASDPKVPAHMLRGHNGYISTLALSHDGHTLVTGGGDSRVVVWNLTSPDPNSTARILPGNEEAVEVMGLSSDGRTLVTGSSDGSVRMWDLGAPYPLRTFDFLRGLDKITSPPVPVLSANGRTLVVRRDHSTIHVWDLTSPDQQATIHILHWVGGDLQEMLLSADGHTLVTTSSDNMVRVWNLTVTDPQTTMRVLHGHEESISALALSKDGHVLATGSDDRTVRVWDLTVPDPQTTVRILHGHEGPISALALNEDGNILVTGIADKQEVVQVEDGQIVVVDSEDNPVRVWDLTMPDPQTTVRVLNGYDSTIRTLALSDDGNVLVTLSIDGKAQLWNLRLRNPQNTVRILSSHNSGVGELVLSGDGRTLVTGSANTNNPGKDDLTAWVWDLTAPNPQTTVRILHGHDRAVEVLALSEDGRVLVSGSSDRTVRVWDLTASDPQHTVRVLWGHPDTVRALAFREDEHTVISMSYDGTVRVWPVDPEAITALACRTAGRNLSASEWEQYFSDEPYRRTCLAYPNGVGN